MKDYRFRYSVEVNVAQGYHTPAGWRERKQGQITGYGKPTDANLAKYVETFNNSIKAGGVNAHLGDGSRIISARIIDHDNNRAIVATYRSPLFEVL